MRFRFKYEDFNLGAWISNNRRGKDKLDSEKIQQLESLPQWSWNPFEDKWNAGFEYLQKYVEEYGHARIYTQLKYKDYLLGSWASEQRKINAKNKLSSERVKLLESLPQWSWNILEEQWNEGVEYLKEYVDEYGHARVPDGLKYQNFNLGAWVSNQRTKKDKLDLKRIQLLESLPQWSWEVFEDRWNEGFEYLKKYIDEYGHARVSNICIYESFTLGIWVATQRYGKSKNKLSSEKIQLLEALPQWTWDVLEDQWNEGYKYLKGYVEKYGHAKVPHNFKYENYSLGQWAGVQRRSKKNNELNSERIKLLESLPQWSWDILENRWNEGFEYLKKYVEEYGHARVPKRSKYNDFNLGAWVTTQRYGKSKNMLGSEKIQLLETLPKWSWGSKSE